MAGRITAALHAGRKVFWLVCGGSNIPLAASAITIIAGECSDRELANLTVGQTDERYGPVGHEDSNWRQMADNGFKFDHVGTLSFLIGKSLAETAATYSLKFDEISGAIAGARGLVIAQFGVGPDGHVAGILPHSPAVTDISLISGYEGQPYTRLTLTPMAFKRIDVAYTFVFGDSKRQAIKSLCEQDRPIAEEPCQLLKTIPESFLYSDLIPPHAD